MADCQEDQFLDLAEALLKLYNASMRRYQYFLETSGIERRKAFYLLGAARCFGDLPIPTRRMRAIGWTKLGIISPYATEENLEALMQLAEGFAAKDLERFLKGGDPGPNCHCVVLYFTEEQHQRLSEALVANGARRIGQGLINREAALMNILPQAGQKPA